MWVGVWADGSRLIIKLNSAQLELELGLSLAITYYIYIKNIFGK
jgi:hypothetical protein